MNPAVPVVPDGLAAASPPSAPARAVLVALTVLGGSVVALSAWILYQFESWNGDPAVLRVILDGAVGIALIGSALVAWVARPGSRVGPLLYITGLLYYVKNLSWTGIGLLVYPSMAFSGAWVITLGIIILGYPAGRLVRRDERLLLVLALGWVVASGILSTLALDTRGCATCWQNPWVVDLPVTYDDVGSVDLVVSAGLWLTFTWFIVRRWQQASRVARRWLAPVWFSGVVMAIIRFGGLGILLLAGPQAEFGFDWLIADPLAVLVPVALAWGLARGRLAQASVGELVVELGAGGSDIGWRHAIARALGDPEVTLAFADPQVAGGLRDLDGHPVDTAGRIVTPVSDEAGTMAYLVHDAGLEANPGLIRAVAAATRLAVDNRRLARDVAANLAEVHASRKRLLEASDAERVRLERDLHDGAQQRLVTLGLRLRSRAELASDADERVAYTALADELDAALGELRELARGLHPTAVTQAGLAGAVEGLAERSTLPLVVDIPDARFPPATEIAAWFVIAEAVTNAVRHARATRIVVSAKTEGEALSVTVEDDGIGGAQASGGSGLAGLSDRVAALGGRLELTSPPGSGTRVHAVLPLVTP